MLLILIFHIDYFHHNTVYQQYDGFIIVLKYRKEKEFDNETNDLWG